MAEPRDALQLLLYDTLTRGRSLATEDDPRAIMRELLSMHGGSIKRAAAAAGIGEQTWRDWVKKGAQPSARSVAKLRATLPARRRSRLPKGRERWMRKQPKIKISAWTLRKSTKGKKSDDHRHRTFKPGAYLPRGALGPMLDLFLSGADMADVASEFVRTIEEYYGGVMIEADQVEELEIVPEGSTFRDGDR